ncbi:hypothetical protein B0H13DRAFT_1870691 [Mycena leptocephala]|nr:hypothetical protein B0H13DRAFT_1870691 [Mycena leptocephala]
MPCIASWNPRQGSDSVRGLCTGLPLINPRRAIVLDGAIDEFGHKPKKNKQVTKLFETLLGIIPKWDKLHEINTNATLDACAEALALALGKSQSLKLWSSASVLGLPDNIVAIHRTGIPTPLPSSSQRSYVLSGSPELKRVGDQGQCRDVDICIGGPVGPSSKKCCILKVNVHLFLILLTPTSQFLQEVALSSLVDVPASIAFLRCQGAKLLRLAAPLEIFMSVSVFDMCKSLNTAVVGHSHRKDASERKPFQLKQGFRKNRWIPLSKLLRRKGIKLIDKNEVGETGSGRRAL